MDIYLGKRYFSVDPEGDITPALILQLPFELPQDSHFDISAALEIAKKRTAQVRDSDDSFAKREAAKRRLVFMSLPSVKFTEGLVSRPVIFRYSNSFLAHERHEIKEDMILEPGSYFLPGETVWAPITPSTHYLFSDAWRPAWFFVLETSIQKVLWAPREGLSYRHGTDYHIHPKHLHRTEVGARAALEKMISEGAPIQGVDLTRIKTYTEVDEAEFGRQKIAEYERRRTSS